MTVDFIYDFGSLNAYLAHKAMPDISARTAAVFRYMPVLLGGVFKLTNNQPPMMAFGGVKGKMDYQMLEIKRFVRDHKITAFKMNPHFPVNTLMLMRGAVVADAEGRSADYIKMGFTALWEEGLNMGDPDVFATRLAKDGFDDYAAKISEPAIKSELMRVTSAAVDRGVFGAPTYFVGDEMFFGKDRLGGVEAEIGRKGK